MSSHSSQLNKEKFKDKNSFVSQVMFESKANRQHNQPMGTKDMFTLPDIESPDIKPSPFLQEISGDAESKKGGSLSSNIKTYFYKKKNRMKIGSLLKLSHQIHDVTYPSSDASLPNNTVDISEVVEQDSIDSFPSSPASDVYQNKVLQLERKLNLLNFKTPNLTPIVSSELDALSILSFDVEDIRKPSYPVNQNKTSKLFLREALPEKKALTVVPVIANNECVNDLENQFPDESLECWMGALSSQLQMIPLHHLLIPAEPEPKEERNAKTTHLRFPAYDMRFRECIIRLISELLRSHDSFSYSLELGEVGPDSPSVIAHLAACSPCIAWPAILRWSVTQKSTVYEQLSHGVRYFDIRVAVRDKRFYFVHGLFGADLEPLLAEIRRFMDFHPGEVVLLDFQHLHGFSKEDHSSLVAILKNVFVGMLCPFYNSLNHLSLSYLSKHGYQALIFYRNSEVQEEFGLWPGSVLPNPWPQSTRVSSLMSFIEGQLEKKSEHKFFVTQCVLTPTSGYLARNLTSSLEKKMAVPCNQTVLNWILSLPNTCLRPNVVMIDFVEDSNYAIPRAVIKQNERIYKHMKKKM